MKNHVYKIAPYSSYECDKVAAYLEEMAENGYFLEKLGSIFWKFRKDTPRKLHFSVVFFPNLSQFDPTPTENQEEFFELCSMQGWNLYKQFGNIHIFLNESDNPIPLETDPVIQVETIFKTMKKTNMKSYICVILLSVFQIFIQIKMFNTNPIDYLSDPLRLSIVIIFVFLLFISGIQAFSMYNWYKKAKSLASQGVFYGYKKQRFFDFFSIIFVSFILLLVICNSKLSFVSIWIGSAAIVIISILVSTFMMNYFKKKGMSKKKNMAISIGAVLILYAAMLSTMVAYVVMSDVGKPNAVDSYTTPYGIVFDVYDDNLPLTLEDLGYTEFDSWSKEANINKTFLLSNCEYDQWPLSEDDIPDLYYSVVTAENEFIYNMVLNTVLEPQDVYSEGELIYSDHYKEIDPTSWHADKVYQLYLDDGYVNTFIICYGNKFVIIRLPFEPNENIMDTVFEKLG